MWRQGVWQWRSLQNSNLGPRRANELRGGSCIMPLGLLSAAATLDALAELASKRNRTRAQLAPSQRGDALFGCRHRLFHRKAETVQQK